MRRYKHASQNLNLGTAGGMISLFTVGLAGIAVGGPLWGFLGAALVLFCAGWICHLFSYQDMTREIERSYEEPAPMITPARITVRVARPRRVGSYALRPLGELESVS